MNIICNPVVLICLLASNSHYNLKLNFLSLCFNSPEVRYDNEYIDGLLSLSATIFKGVYISVLIELM